MKKGRKKILKVNAKLVDLGLKNSCETSTPLRVCTVLKVHFEGLGNQNVKNKEEEKLGTVLEGPMKFNIAVL